MSTLTPPTTKADMAAADGDRRSPSQSSSERKSSVGDDYDEVVDESNLRYGCFGARPDWLQRLNTIVGFVAWLSMANCFHNMALGLVGVVLSTLEKRFDFSSSSSSWIASAYEIGPIPVLIVISYFGNRIHRPLSCAVGMLMVALGCVLFFLPQFTTPVYRPSEEGDGDTSNLCIPDGNRTSGCRTAAESLSGYLPMFIIARLLTGAGATPIYTLGLTYMDDCANRGKFATYTGIFNAMSVVGPALAFVGGGLMLNIFVDFYVLSPEEIGISPTDSSWIGAWWLPYTITAALSLLNAIPMWGYPVDLPGAAEIRRHKVTEAHNDAGADQPNPAAIAYIKTWSEFKALFKSVMTNPTYLCLTIFACCDNFIISGFTAFGPKVFEVGFTFTAAVAGAIFGIVLLPAGAAGTIIGGVIIEKLRLSCRQIIRIQAVLTAIVTAGICLLLLTCAPLNFAGVNMAYNTSMSSSSSSSDTLNVTDVCNVGCSCEHVSYSPICSHDNIMYYSPCHAGCSLSDDADTKNYYNCSCIASPSDLSRAEATSDACTAESCPVSIVFMVIFFFAVGFIFVCFTMNMAATLRCVSSSQTSFAIGIQVLFIKLLGTVPGPLLMGVVFDSSCVLWQYDECGVRGSCLFYDNKELAIQLFAMCFSIKVVSLVAMVLAVVLYKPPATVEPLVKDVLPVLPEGGQMVTVSSTVAEKLDSTDVGRIKDAPNGHEKKSPINADVVHAAVQETNEGFEDHSIHL